MSLFVEFTVAQGTSRVARVADSKRDYDPKFDFYKAFRERAVRQLVAGWSAQSFRRSLQEVRNPRKQASYEACRAGLTRWTRSKELDARRAQNGTWEAAGLEVRVNPELRLVADGKRYLVKLYFKAEEISAGRLDNTLFLLSEIAPKGVEAAILDTRRGKLITSGEMDPALDALLISEAAAFGSLL
jgi:hypothetical protein